VIHRTALVDPTAHIEGDVTVGPYAIIGPRVTVGERCHIAAHAVLERNVKLGHGVKVGYGSVLGNDPQDLKYKGEDTWVEVGDTTVIREYCTINRGTQATGKTSVGQRCFLMSYVHLAHDCHVGNDVIIANAVQMAGHVTIEDRAIISGLVPIHQFVRIGTFSFVGGGSREPGRPALHQGRGQSGSPLRLELRGPAACRVLSRREAGPEARLPAAVQFRHDGEPGNRQGARRAAADSRSRELPQVHRRVAAGSAGVTAPPVRVGVIGTGALGFHHVRLLRRMAGVSFAGIYDKNPARAAEVAKQLETVAHPALAALLERVDAVTVAVPTPAHVDVGMAVLQRGIALLMEKPLADTVAGAEALVRGAAAQGTVLQVGHVERFNRAVRAAAPYLDEPRFLQIDRLSPFQPRGTDVAVILDLMIHDLDLVLELVRAPVTDVRATGVAILTPHVDIANARIEFANGAIANLTASRVSRERTRKLRIFQPTGYCSLDLAQGSGDFFRLKPGWQGLGATTLEQIVDHVRLEAPEAEPLKLELESFLRAVRGEEDVVVSGAAGAQALALAFRVASAIQASPLAPPPPAPLAASRP